MTVREAAIATNPLARAAELLPARAAVAVSIAARVLGALSVLWYAYDQYDAFDGRYFPRTWAYAVAVAVLAVVSMVPVRGWAGVAASAAGAGLLVFAGAILAREPWGVAALVAGAVAWLAVASAAYQRGGGSPAAIVGLFAGAGLAFAVAVGVALGVGE
ncbi:MAG: hypothetical protein IT303_10135 [Dehalococcoidia bacterium]|nr:hypothetical protein [Dehalococcoidia bacterium]